MLAREAAITEETDIHQPDLNHDRLIRPAAASNEKEYQEAITGRIRKGVEGRKDRSEDLEDVRGAKQAEVGVLERNAESNNSMDAQSVDAVDMGKEMREEMQQNRHDPTENPHGP
ncbi:hypothetical protein PENCOP_c018G09014 [Penicillium coprophilum]|uniref:Uncharacterized protein n=1 Tax=Penicillium coprophilum TaxID=36646 RepID=A0A1V6U7A5_9EURO|nr:hypothetical protein PENCOP_c018G09014 [Penicillium coprophilum]